MFQLTYLSCLTQCKLLCSNHLSSPVLPSASSHVPINFPHQSYPLQGFTFLLTFVNSLNKCSSHVPFNFPHLPKPLQCLMFQANFLACLNQRRPSYSNQLSSPVSTSAGPHIPINVPQLSQQAQTLIFQTTFLISLNQCKFSYTISFPHIS
jgi:hypothetical protein